jgi:hypothetical protein
MPQNTPCLGKHFRSTYHEVGVILELSRSWSYHKVRETGLRNTQRTRVLRQLAVVAVAVAVILVVVVG